MIIKSGGSALPPDNSNRPVYTKLMQNLMNLQLNQMINQMLSLFGHGMTPNKILYPVSLVPLKKGVEKKGTYIFIYIYMNNLLNAKSI